MTSTSVNFKMMIYTYTCMLESVCSSAALTSCISCHSTVSTITWVVADCFQAALACATYHHNIMQELLDQGRSTVDILAGSPWRAVGWLHGHVRQIGGGSVTWKLHWVRGWGVLKPYSTTILTTIGAEIEDKCPNWYCRAGKWYG